MKARNFHSLIGFCCRHTQSYGVQIAVDQFYDEEAGDYVPELDILCDRVKEAFPDEFTSIMSSVVSGEILFFNTKEEARKLYDIMEGTEFYSIYYAALYGPEGAMTENT